MQARKLVPAIAAMLLAVTAALAQTDDDAQAEVAPTDEQAADTADKAVTADSASQSPAGPDRAPTDYRATEEISEDLSVSFPVDI